MRDLIILVLLMGATLSPVFAEEADEKSSVIWDSIYEFPLTYREKPIGFSEQSNGYTEVPPGFSERPIGAVEVPSGFREKPMNALDAPRGFSETPPNFIEKDNHPQVNKDPEYQIDPTTHFAANNDESLRMTTEDRPEAAKNVSKSSQ